MRYAISFVIFCVILNQVNAQTPRTDQFLSEILHGNKDPLFTSVIKNAGKHRLQIIYTEINRDRKNRPSFNHYYFNYDPEMYFNPASMVKMPLAFLSLEKLNKLKKHEIDKHTTVLFDSSESWQHPLLSDNTSETGLPCI